MAFGNGHDGARVTGIELAHRSAYRADRRSTSSGNRGRLDTGSHPRRIPCRAIATGRPTSSAQYRWQVPRTNTIASSTTFNSGGFGTRVAAPIRSRLLPLTASSDEWIGQRLTDRVAFREHRSGRPPDTHRETPRDDCD
jgi:hypothetical protein